MFDKIDDDLSLFNHMLRTHPRLSLVEFNQLLGTIFGLEHYETVVTDTLITQMELLGIHHDVFTLNIVLNCFRRLHHVGFGISVLGRMLKLGLEPDIVAFNKLISGLCIGGKVAQAVPLLEDMVREGC